MGYDGQYDKKHIICLLAVYIDPFMLRIIYKSKQRKSISGAEFDALCAQAKIKNNACGVTGLLLKSETEFLQCIEGPVKEVSATFKRICCDPRHYDIQVLEVRRTIQRMFSQWTMLGVSHTFQNPSEEPSTSGDMQLNFSAHALKRTWSRSGTGLTAYIYEHEQVYNMLEKRGELHLLPQVLPFLSK